MTTRARALYESLLWRVDAEYTAPTVAEISTEADYIHDILSDHFDSVLAGDYCCDACIIEGRTVDHMLRWDRHTIEVDQETFEAMLDPTPDPAPRLRVMVKVAAQRHLQMSPYDDR